MKKESLNILIFAFAIILFLGIQIIANINVITRNKSVVCPMLGIRQEFSGLVVKRIETNVHQLQIQINDYESTTVYIPSKTLFYFADKGDSLFKIKDRNECIVKKKNQNGYYLVQFSESESVTEELPFPVDSSMLYNKQPVTVKVLSGKEIENIRVGKYSN